MNSKVRGFYGNFRKTRVIDRFAATDGSLMAGDEPEKFHEADSVTVLACYSSADHVSRCPDESSIPYKTKQADNYIWYRCIK
jgi:hypothetical protein